MYFNMRLLNLMLQCNILYLLNYVVSGKSLPLLGVGTAGLGGRTKSIVCESLLAGFTLIDSAQAIEWYDEVAAGEALRDIHCYPPASDFPNLNTFVVTKVHPRSYCRDDLTAALDLSSRRLSKTNISAGGNEALDAVLLHAPWCWRGQCTKEQEACLWQDAFRQLVQYYQSNMVSYIGVSNFGVRQIEEMISLLPVAKAGQEPVTIIVQNWMDPFNQDKDVRELLFRHSSAGVARFVYMAYSSLGTQWVWKLKRNPVFTSDVLSQIAESHTNRLSGICKTLESAATESECTAEVTVTMVVLTWLRQLQQANLPVIAIPRATSTVHIRQNAALLGNQDSTSPVFVLSEDEMEVIGNLDGSLGSLW